jgi:LPXTG-site transpeptidase (sortase) family protein
MMLGVALVFALATVVTSLTGGGNEDETAFKPIDAAPPASGITPSSLPSVNENLPTPPALVRLLIPALQLDAPIVRMGTDRDGAMQPPASPFTVAWYDFSAVPGQGGNIVLAGHAEYPNHGAAVFHDLGFVQAGDELQLVLPDFTTAHYTVTSAETYDAATAPVEAIVGPTEAEVVTLIVTSAPDDASKRLVIRGDLVVAGAIAR